jgi:hypothetical protein
MSGAFGAKRRPPYRSRRREALDMSDREILGNLALSLFLTVASVNLRCHYQKCSNSKPKLSSYSDKNDLAMAR